ncbi:MAG: hypothetical protein ACLFNQ_12755 [Spirochaetaceae bacterium]
MSNHVDYISASIVVGHGRDVAEVYNRNDGEQLQVETVLLNLLRYCSEARTLHEHCSTIMSDVGHDATDHAVFDGLKALVRLGLLRPVLWPEPRAGRGETEVTHEPQKTFSFCIPTIGRTRVIERLLGSIDRNCNHANVLRSTIYLDTDIEEVVTEIQRIVRERDVEPAAVRWRVSGKSVRRELVRDIDRALDLSAPEREAVEFGLFGQTQTSTTVGAARSCAFLSAGSTALFSMDDDAVMLGYTGRNADASPRISTRPGPSWKYESDREALLRAFPAAPIDPVSTAAGYIGRRVSDISSGGKRLRWDPGDVTPELWYRVERYDPTIDLVSFGYLGDSGTGSTPILPSAAVEIPQLHGNAESQKLALSSREVLQMAETPTITTQPFFMSAACAFNLERILPPFFPFGRGQDGLFGTMLTRLFEDALIAHVPIAVLHDPQDGRSNRLGPEAYTRMAMGVTRIVVMIVSHYASRTSGGTREERLVDCGEWLSEHASDDISAFRLWVTEIVCSALRQYRSTIERSYGDAMGSDSPLGRTVDSLLADVDDRIATGRVGPVSEYEQIGLGDAETFERLAHHLYLFGTLLTLWPAIWAERKSLRL